jgi:hypothetical protein
MRSQPGNAARAAARLGAAIAAGAAGVARADAGRGADPADPILVIVLAVAVAALFGSPRRAGRTAAATLGGLAAGLLVLALDGRPGLAALAAGLGAAVAFTAPAQGPQRRADWPATGGGSAVARW